ncbi:hypothetical protein [Microbacterium enclense]|uniref:hypothetical protein n=1 Tax=Microbacterium enclense TaxID=993073 RepID=UPI0034162C41
MPVVAVCPVHGAFPSRMIVVEGATGVTLSNSSEPCPECGRRSTVMEGTYDFDGRGIATVIVAPEWSRQALHQVQRDLAEAARVLRDTRNYSDDRAYAALDRRLERIEKQYGREGRELADEIRAVKKRNPRQKFWMILGGIAIAVGCLADLPQAIENAAGWLTDVVNWSVEQYESGREPRVQDAPSPGSQRERPPRP